MTYVCSNSKLERIFLTSHCFSNFLKRFENHLKNQHFSSRNVRKFENLRLGYFMIFMIFSVKFAEIPEISRQNWRNLDNKTEQVQEHLKMKLQKFETDGGNSAELMNSERCRSL